MTPYRTREDIPDSVKKELGGYSPLLQKLLYYRGITTAKEADVFTDPNWDRDVGDPFLILNMEKAVERILTAIEKNEKAVIYSDYDADGIPGSVVLHDLFRKVGYANFSNYIPHRHDEGYGLNADAIASFIEEKITLIITVDLGITDIEHVARAQKSGIDVIVTDHHMPIVKDGKDRVPEAYAVINSKQQDDTYHDDTLCGAGVAFKLSQAILRRGRERGLFGDIPDGWEKWLLDMTGLATLADMVPLRKENRALARYGLTVLRKSKRPGLVVLLQKLGISQKDLTEDDLGFMIVPRINAASRMDHPLRAFELLSTQDEAEAERLADHLNHINDKRKGSVAAIIKEAKKRLNSREIGDVVVIGDAEWSPGLLGLVANKLIEEHEKPAFVWGYDGNGSIKGSCRGIGNVSVVEMMRAAPHGMFLEVGGHHDAGGFSIARENIHDLERVLSAIYSDMKALSGTKDVFVDAELSIDDVTWTTFFEVDRLSPFGTGNEKPVFMFRDVTVDAVRLFGKEKNHLGLDLHNSTGKKVSAIGFFMHPDMFPGVLIAAGEKVDLVAVLERSVFRNILELRLRIEMILPSSAVH